MSSLTDVRRQLRQVGLGVGVGTAALLGLVALCGQASWQAALGALVGAALAFGNFFFTARAVTRAVDAQEEATGILRRSYFRRMLVIFLSLAAGFDTGVIWWLTSIIPLAFPKLSLYIAALFAKNHSRKGDEL